VPKFYGPYIVLKRVGQVEYQLALPSQSKLHHVFHVSCLKKVIGTRCQIQTNLPELVEEGSIWLHPKAVLDKREHRLCQRTIKEVLVQCVTNCLITTTILVTGANFFLFFHFFFLCVCARVEVAT
jgi:hypothetical protein